MGEDDVSISVSDLRAAVTKVLDAVVENLGGEITLPGDSYWMLELAQAYRADSKPTVTSVGSLSDDVATVHELLADRGPEEVFVWHDLSHVIGVLGGIADIDRRKSKGL